MPTHKIAFPGSQGATLAGQLDTPDQPPHAWAIFAHCFTCSKDSKAAAYISRAGTRRLWRPAVRLHRPGRQ